MWIKIILHLKKKKLKKKFNKLQDYDHFMALLDKKANYIKK